MFYMNIKKLLQIILFATRLSFAEQPSAPLLSDPKKIRLVNSETDTTDPTKTISQKFIESGAKNLGVEPKFVLGEDLVHVDILEELQSIDGKVVTDGSTDVIDILRIDGKPVVILGNEVGLLEEDGSVNLLSIFDRPDIFDQVQKAIAKEAQKQKKDIKSISSIISIINKYFSNRLNSLSFDFNAVNFKQIINEVPKYLGVTKDDRYKDTATNSNEGIIEIPTNKTSIRCENYVFQVTYNKSIFLITFHDYKKHTPIQVAIELFIKENTDKQAILDFEKPKLTLSSYYAPEFKKQHDEIMKIIYNNISSEQIEEIKQSIKDQTKLSEWREIRESL